MADELAAGAKSVVMYFGKAAQALRTQSGRDPVPRGDVQGYPAPGRESGLAASYERYADELAAIEALRSGRPAV